MVPSRGLKQSQAPPEKQLTSNGGGGRAGTAAPLSTPQEQNAMAFPTLEAQPVACIRDLLQTYLEKPKIPEALTRGVAAQELYI